MLLTIWRHGQAGSAASDRVRELTAQGRADIGLGVQRFAQQCEKRGLAPPDHILFSEWVRTRQTAGILASFFPDAPCTACTALVPGRYPADVDNELDARWSAGPAQHLLLVSHQPLVSALVDHYLGQPGRVAPLLPGGLATLQLDVFASGCGSLCFSAQPPEYEAVV
ncbi:SixA phosphatase family protein [Pseudohalioglobus lutimaris]|uniref:Phosphohistidine phosphatase SixA n=1 Tax=Pseudohalioglobus lutimaris TaxID=1737061 RepID=A0A2N5X2T1_9GAMM|nr:hypothetical protein [Pseudohalioglobus lutimaris]PLW68801.1 hypothetical protein C0039_11045 [Pseudohalioglobus lutimaris]